MLRAAFGGYRMGSEVPLRSATSEEGVVIGIASGDGPVPGVPPNTLVVQAHGVDVIERIDIVRSGLVIESVDCGKELRCSFGIDFASLEANEYVYVRVDQVDGGMAWSSPFYFVAS